ncbi:MAG: hypothetical protein SVM86_06335 [Candidatus Cloacimonadota bacterium]|nr:hypothetical protein [Candidatus Cloacimonadota bacterium]
MVRRFLLILLLLICWEIHAEDELLQLKDIIIEGEGAEADSVPLFSTIKAKTKPDSMKLFNFHPYLENKIFKEPQKKKAEKKFYSILEASSTVSAEAKLGWQFTNDFNVSGQAALQDLPDDWKNTNYHASLNLGKNENWISADYFGFHSQNQLYDTDYNKFQISANKMWQNFQLFWQVGWQQLQQEDFEENQIPITTSANFQTKKYDAKISFYHLLEESNIEFYLQRRNTLWLDKLGLWGAYDGKDYYFSAILNKNLRISEHWRFYLQNKPQFFLKNLPQLWQQNYFFDLDVQMSQTKMPINLMAGLMLNAQIPWKIEYNLFKYEDKFVFRENGLGYYNLQQTNLWQQQFKTELFYQIDGLEILPQFTYNQYSKDIAYLPQVQAELKIAYKQPGWQVQARLQLNRDRQDETGAELEDLPLMEISGCLKLSENLALTAKATNLLDENVSLYPLLPQQKREIWLGVVLGN